jgi:hypothetical protein
LIIASSISPVTDNVTDLPEGALGVELTGEQVDEEHSLSFEDDIIKFDIGHSYALQRDGALVVFHS